MFSFVQLFIVTVVTSLVAAGFDWSAIDLPHSHLPYFFYNNGRIEKMCVEDPLCPFKEHAGLRKCFGYETKCPEDNMYFKPSCPEDTKWAKSKKDQYEMFFNAGDFGVIKEKRRQLQAVCKPQKDGDAFLQCEKHARYCRGQNIMIDFRKSKFSKSYDTELIKLGDIGGRCKMDRTIKELNWDPSHSNALQSWYYVIEKFTEFPEHESSDCDVIIEKPAYLVQTDAEVNMFHHFCDFVNLYVTQHLNDTSFDRDVDIIVWDTTGRQIYHDPFAAAWTAFSTNTVKVIGEFIGKRVCFNDVIFTLPPRQRLGLFYNMPLIEGCYNTGLFRAFNEYFMHRLKISQLGPLKNKIRIKILSRKSRYRNILNEQELLDALNSNPRYEAEIVTYKFAQNRSETVNNFIEQINSSHNTDIFVGMHGAGLTHMLFLPHWASVIELYHCDDPRCYSTLARLRGVKYFTWKNMNKLHQEDEGHHPTLGAHKKFTNYEFDVDEFLRLISLAADHVTRHPEYRAAKRTLYKRPTDEL